MREGDADRLKVLGPGTMQAICRHVTDQESDVRIPRYSDKDSEESRLLTQVRVDLSSWPAISDPLRCSPSTVTVIVTRLPDTPYVSANRQSHS